MKKVWSWLDKMLKQGSEQSSKRFFGFIGLLISGGLSFAYTRHDNLAVVLGMWLGFVASALMITAYEKTKSNGSK